MHETILSSIRRCAVGCTVIAVGATTGQAAMLVDNTTGLSQTFDQPANPYVGYSFATGAKDLTVNKVGYLKLSGTLVDSHNVYLYKLTNGNTWGSTGTANLIATWTVDKSNVTYSDGFAWSNANVSATLDKNSRYLLLSYETAGDQAAKVSGAAARDTYFNLTDLTTNSAQYYDIWSYTKVTPPANGESPVAASNNNNLTITANLQYVPEPASLALLMLGSVALLRRRR